nr:serine/threonine-protein phosphatase 7 long form homolog [Arachis hypogaea]
MPKKQKYKDVNRPELHIIHYLSHPDYSLRYLTCDHLLPPNRYNDKVEEHLRFTGFLHVSQIGVVQCQKALVNALVERWHPDTHTFHLPVGECAVTLEDVVVILGLPTDGLLVTGMTMSSFEALEAEYLQQFGVAPRKSDCRASCIKLTWLRDLKERLQLVDETSMQSIGQYSWGSACLAHLYRSLCRASRFDYKEIDGPLTLLLTWAWMRLPYLASVPREPRSFPLANRWRNWEHGDRRFRYLTLEHFRKALDDLQEGQFVWLAYAVDRIDPDIIPADIYMHSVVWSATVPLVSFEIIEWHATDRFRRQFGFVQGVPHQEQNLDKAHGMVLTGPKNLDWATATTHSFWVMQWTNRYNHILTELSMPPQHPLDIYMSWYRARYGNHLNLSDRVGQENDEGNQVMDDDNEEQEPQSPPPPPLPPPPLTQEQLQCSNSYVPQIQFTTSYPLHQQYWGTPQLNSGEGASFSQLLGFMAAEASQSQYGHQPDIMAGRYSLDAMHPNRTSSVSIGGLVSGDSSRSDGSRRILNSQNPRRVSMGLIEENARTVELETDEYLVDNPDDEDDDEDEDEDMDEDEESSNDASGDDDGEARTPAETGKCYNLRVDPPRRSAKRYTPSMFKRISKKCKDLVDDIKWARRK